MPTYVLLLQLNPDGRRKMLSDPDSVMMAARESESSDAQILGMYAVLGEFATRNINLAKVESRPNKEIFGRYIFLVDLEGHREDPLVKEALSGVQSDASMMKILGSYPRYAGESG